VEGVLQADAFAARTPSIASTRAFHRRPLDVLADLRKEAVVSSQIEGTEATLDDLLAFEATREGTKPGAGVGCSRSCRDIPS
jgi:Fic family protein